MESRPGKRSRETCDPGCRLRRTGLSENQVSLMCNCGCEIVVTVDPDAENEVTCEKCGQQYRFYGRSVLRW